MEALFSESERIAIQSIAYPGEAHFNKTHFNRAIQEHLLIRRMIPILSDTQANFKNIGLPCS
jgi:hypothetical protein